MEPVIQEETTGCGIASAAAIAGISYQQAKAKANQLGIRAQDSSLWSDHRPVPRLLAELGFKTEPHPTTFSNWENLPDCALLATKWQLHNGRPCWHWAVFVREPDKAYVLDSKKNLRTNLRTDFGRIKPKWFIAVEVGKS